MIQTHPFDAALGAEISGIDLEQPLSPTDFHALHDALMAHQVLFFRDQDISHAAHRDFALHFGPAMSHPAYPTIEGYPEITVLQADRENPSKIEKWHTDMTFRPNPPLGSVLRSRIIPVSKGDTWWLSLSAAYEALSPCMRTFLDGLHAEHSFAHGFRESLAEPGGREQLADAVAANPPLVHPVVRTHPVTQRRCLFVNDLFTTRIVELQQDESDALLQFLFAHMVKDDFTCRFQWQPHSIAFWDNRCTQHRPDNNYWPHLRQMERITIEGGLVF